MSHAPRAGFTIIPNELFDIWLPVLTPKELLVLLYIARRTYGFHREEVEVGVRLIAHGIPGKDSGTGLHIGTVSNAVNALKRRGLLRFTAGSSGRRTYSINLSVRPTCSDNPNTDCSEIPNDKRSQIPNTIKEREIKQSAVTPSRSAGSAGPTETRKYNAATIDSISDAFREHSVKFKPADIPQLIAMAAAEGVNDDGLRRFIEYKCERGKPQTAGFFRKAVTEDISAWAKQNLARTCPTELSRYVPR